MSRNLASQDAGARRYAAVEPRCEIHRSLRTDSEREARVRLPAAEAAVLAELDARLTMGQSQEPGTVFSAAAQPDRGIGQ
ncbi:hypothetical protein [Marivita sp. XM-24bin2]|uniref:hypothetical protein n=1 Tax=unclassified Marivita TaxID=2632480 RepID=UPI000D7A2935|nr:hypothetical protein [Marivita sp. XM-24bin2]MCR9108629.1 hypothetical protein [Paracoccaceae bacterium]PWL33454.1 MAG: hypothetical protein DCO97_19500 [Marivita sp. XM-24bin2]